MGIVENILARFGFIEVMLRRILYNIPSIKNKVISVDKQHKVSSSNKLDDFLLLQEQIKKFGIRGGDLLIVHSSIDALAKTGATPKFIIDYLIDLVGSDGTLVFPAYPDINRKYDYKSVPVYDPKRSVSWTGMLPNLFCRYKGVIRSPFPYNSLAAKGLLAKDMVCHNLEGDLPHGRNSAWAFCVEHNAKILFLGTKAHHSNTVLHVAEELMDDDWPIKDWYETQNYQIKLGDTMQDMTVRVRKMIWAQYMHEYSTAYKLKKGGYLTETSIDGINIGFINDSKKLTEFLINEAKKGHLIYSIPHKYWRK